MLLYLYVQYGNKLHLKDFGYKKNKVSRLFRINIGTNLKEDEHLY